MMMMKTSVTLLLAFFGSALAAPAVVWKNGGAEENKQQLRTSDNLNASDLLVDILSLSSSSSTEKSLASVVFVIGRGTDGSESLSTLASSGSLPNVALKYDTADAVHHHIAGVESSDSMVRDAIRANPTHNVLSISLNELNTRLEEEDEQPPKVEMEISQTGLMSKTQRHSHQRAQKLFDATVLIVNVDPKKNAAADIDNTIIRTIDNKSIDSVVLTAVRSHAEVKHERAMESQRRLKMMEQAGQSITNKNNKIHGRRRLEDMQGENNQQNGQQQQQNNQNGNGNDDMTGVYYVSMTPNILAGILFTIMFTVVTWIGVSCMGMIQGQDVYVSKLPPVGREA